jgi:hypothetical protein
MVAEIHSVQLSRLFRYLRRKCENDLCGWTILLLDVWVNFMGDITIFFFARRAARNFAYELRFKSFKNIFAAHPTVSLYWNVVWYHKLFRILPFKFFVSLFDVFHLRVWLMSDLPHQTSTHGHIQIELTKIRPHIQTLLSEDRSCSCVMFTVLVWIIRKVSWKDISLDSVSMLWRNERVEY